MMVLPVVFPYTTLNKYDCRILWFRIGLHYTQRHSCVSGDGSIHPSIPSNEYHPSFCRLSSVPSTIIPVSMISVAVAFADFQYLRDPLQYLYSYAPLVTSTHIIQSRLLASNIPSEPRSSNGLDPQRDIELRGRKGDHDNDQRPWMRFPGEAYRNQKSRGID